MADLTQYYNASNVQEQDDDFTPIPAGWYQAKAERVELKPTRAGNGRYLEIMWRISGPSHGNRTVFDRITISNPSPKATEIGQATLKALHVRAGISNLTNTDQLVGVNMEIKVRIRQDEGYEPSNEVKSYRAPKVGGPPPVSAPPKPGSTSSNWDGDTPPF